MNKTGSGDQYIGLSVQPEYVRPDEPKPLGPIQADEQVNKTKGDFDDDVPF
jgi:hypothetical protein